MPTTLPAVISAVISAVIAAFVLLTLVLISMLASIMPAIIVATSFVATRWCVIIVTINYHRSSIVSVVAISAWCVVVAVPIRAVHTIAIVIRASVIT